MVSRADSLTTRARPGCGPYLLEAYPSARRWQARTGLVFHAIRFARVSDAAYALGLRAIGDKSYMVRYRACMVLAYSLRTEAIPALQALLQHADARTREDAARALDAIQHQNHHYCYVTWRRAIFRKRDYRGRDT